MLGYKFINVKIQTALIKQVIYSYLFNFFLVAPNSFFKSLLTNIDKENFESSSKEKFDEFIRQNKNIKDQFYIDLNKENKFVLRYMYLTCILNTDMKTNFNNFNDADLEFVGKQSLDNLFYDVFLEFLNSVKKAYDINNDVENSISKNATNYFNSNSLETLTNAATYTETLDNFNQSCFIAMPGIYSKNSEDYLDMTSQLDIIKSDNFKKNNPEDFKNIIKKNSGLAGEFYYKIKEEIPVQLNCGSKAKKYPILISIRNPEIYSKFHEVFCVQQYFDWKKDDSYRELEQFIFIRETDTNSIFEESGEQTIGFLKKNNTILQTQNFNESQYFGTKYLKREEILGLKEKLSNIKDTNNGFVALIPVTKVSNEFIDNFNNTVKNTNTGDAGYKIYLSTFNKKEKSTSLSYSEVCKLLSQNDSIKNNDWTSLTTATQTEFMISIPTSNSKEFLKNYRTGIFLKAQYKGSQFSSYEYNTNFNINHLFDIYFRVNFLSYELGSNNTIYTGKNLDDSPNKSSLLTKEFNNSYNEEDIINKKGKFLVLVDPNAFSKIGVLNQTFDNIDNLVINNSYNRQYFLQTRQQIFEILLNQNSDNVFYKEFAPSFFQIFYRLESPLAVQNKKQPLFDYDNLLYIKSNFSEKILNILQGDSFKEFINTFYTPENEQQTSTTDLSAIIVGDYKKNSDNSTDFNLLSQTKPLRTYKNFKDYINYYVNSVESLAMGVQDNV